jgi:hypothetical protein
MNSKEWLKNEAPGALAARTLKSSGIGSPALVA